ncbi:MAG: hypothetical protein R3190_04635 [Thermoanaerobaculia bacterium]|nr:hypothetical protein [Thermoanaerobaculia bacterium]
MPATVLLGPQLRRPTFPAWVEELAPRGPLALVTAGWREREAEDDEIRRRLAGREVLNLELGARSDAVFREEPNLADRARAARGARLELQRLYRRRLDHALAAARELQGLDDDGEILEAARGEALEAVRELDRRHLERTARIRREHDAALEDPPAALALQRAEVAASIEAAAAVLIAGGHVEVLLDCLRLFDVEAGLRRRPLIAWSAGAMALSERIVLFHDRPPWGAGNAECLAHGLAVCRDVQPFPHARRRLRVRDDRRVALLARRFAPALCLGLDEGSVARTSDGAWQVRSVLHLRPGGGADLSGEDDWEELMP